MEPQTTPEQLAENILKHKFSSAEDIIKDEVFIRNVDKIMTDIRKQNNRFPNRKRTFYDGMTDEGIYTKDFFIANIIDIWQKRSKLSRVYRDAIQSVCDTALRNTIVYYHNQEKLKAG